METAFIITDKNKMPYAVVSILKGGTEFHPLSENAKTWSGWMNDEYAVRQVTKGQLTATLDNSMSVEGPIAYARNNKLRLDELIAQAKKIPVVEQIEGKKSVDELQIISILDAQLSQLDDSEWHNAIQFKAGAFVADSNKASMNFEVKRTRALWDAGLSIPGTNRRGGWRCPPGMAFGGQITDRFGRNCGAGLARRLANGLQNVGERIENADDAKRGKRVARRNAAMGRRLAGAGAIERGAGRIADALETNLPKAPAGRVVGAPVRKIRGAGVVERGAGRLADALETKPPKVRGAGRIERGAGRLADALETRPPKRTRIGRIERGAGRLADALETRPPKVKPKRTIVGEADRTPIRDNAIRRGLRDIAPDLMAYAEGAEAGVRGRRNPVYEGTPEKLPSGGVRKPKAPKAAAATAKPRKPRVAPVAPKKPKAPKEPKLVDDVSGIPVPKGLPRNNESLSDYMTRKYNEHQEQIRLIQKGGGKAGFLKRPEWDKFHGPEVEANWKKKNAGRAARATASDAKAPKKPVAPKKPAAPKKPFDSPKKGFDDLMDAQRARALHEADINRAQAHKIVRYDGKYFVVEDGEVIRANAAGANLNVVPEPPRPPARPPVVVTPPTPVVTAPTAPKKPRARKGDVVDTDIKPKRSPKNTGKKGLANIDNAIDHLQKNDGLLADLPENVVAEAVIDNNLRGNPAILGKTRSEIMRGGFKANGLRQGDTFENDRYKFKLVKETSGYGIWDVVEVVDKDTKEKWFLKASQFGQHDAMLENIGMAAAEALDFGNDANHIKMGDEFEAFDGRNARWTMMRDINQWEHGGQRGNQPYADAIDMPPQLRSKIELRDAARLAVMDFVFDNQDRHGRNFMFAENAKGQVRLGVIDNGLFAGGRVEDGDFKRYAKEVKGLNVAEYKAGNHRFSGNNGINGLRKIGFRHQDAPSRERFAEQARRSVARIQQELDSILDIKRIEGNGVKLSSTEKQHLAAVRTIAEARIAHLLNPANMNELVGMFN